MQSEERRSEGLLRRRRPSGSWELRLSEHNSPLSWPGKSMGICLRRGFRSTSSDELQMGRKAAGGKSSRAIARAQLFGGIAEGTDEEAVGFIEHPARLVAPGVEARGRRFLRLLGASVGILRQNRLDTERRHVLSRGCSLDFNLVDQRGDPRPDLLRGETLPAGERD